MSASDLPAAVLKPERRFSLAWLLPLAMLAFAGWLGARAWQQRGTGIEIRFEQGHGLKAGGEVQYRGIRIGAVTDVAFHPTDGRSLVSAAADGTVQVWNARSGEKLETLHVSPAALGVRVAYSPDGRRLAVVSGESPRAAVTIWDTATAKRTDSFPGQTAADMCVAFSPDGRHVASAGMASASMASANMDFDVRVREAATGKLLSVVPNHKWPINGVAFSPDGRFLASGSNDSTVRICDWKTGEQLPTLRPQFAARVAGAAHERVQRRARRGGETCTPVGAKVEPHRTGR